MSEPIEELKQRIEEEVSEKEDVGREELEEDMNSVYEKVKRRPLEEDMNSFGEYSDRDYVEEYGSWEEAVDTILEEGAFDGSELDSHTEGEIPREKLIKELQRLVMKTGSVPSAKSMDIIGKYSSYQYRKEFGEWSEALRVAQIPRMKSSGKQDKAECKSGKLIEEVQKVAMKLERVPTGHDATEHGEYPYIEYYREFGTWDNVLRIAEIEEEGHEKTVIGVNQHGSRLEENDD